MKPIKIIRRSVRKVVPSSLRAGGDMRNRVTTAYLHLVENTFPLLLLSLNSYKQRQARSEIRKCRSIADIFAFMQRHLDGAENQKISEIVSAIEYLQPHSPRYICEIGAQRGGTNFVLRYALTNVEIVIGIDLFVRYAPQLRLLKREGQRLYLLNGSSYSIQMVRKVEKILSNQKLDVLFIDGDHEYEGVKKDFLFYKHLVRESGFILFHDIVLDRKTRFGEDTPGWSGGVPMLWEELKQIYPYEEFVQDSNQDGMGIGLIRYSSEIVLPIEFMDSCC